MTKDITFDNLAKYQNDLLKIKGSFALARAVQNNGIEASSKNPAVKKDLNRVFSIELEDQGVTNQKQSGRCWLFATQNTLRHDFAKKYKVKNFEFSQNYNSFYDRLEKANHFLEGIIRLADRPNDDRELMALYAWNDSDGGQWANAIALFEKYGMVPKSAMPETYTSEKTSDLNNTLQLKMYKSAVELRKMFASGKSEDELRDYKQSVLSDVYRMLVYAFGQPPVKFDFEYRDDDKQYHIDRDLTPQDFYHKYINRDFTEYVTVVDAPDHEYNKVYGIPSQDYIFNGTKNKLVNVGLQAVKNATIESLKAGEAVWFGCDVLQDMERQEGILASEYFKREELFDTELQLDKASRLATHQAHVSHAMTFVGVDLVEGKPTKWKVENSWGDKNGDKGFYIMSDEWFDRYVYEAIVNKKFVDNSVVELSKQKPENLTSWDSLM